MEPARRRLTYRDLLRADAPDAPVPELVDGHIVYKASPRASHAYAHARIVQGVGPAEGGPRDGWWILIEPDVVFSDHRVLRPDLAGWRKERLPELLPAPISLAPAWVCEILSPGHEAHGRVTKRAIYAEEGVSWLWLVSPEERTVEAFELHGRTWVLVATRTAGEARLAPFDHTIDVDGLSVPRRPDEPPVVRAPEIRYG